MTASPFAASLRFYRQQAGLTQLQLAIRSGISESAVARSEQGRVPRPQERTLRALGDALGVPAGRLLKPPPVLPERASGEPAPVAPLVPPGLSSPVAGAGNPAPLVDHARGAGPRAPGAAVAGRGQRAVPGATPEALSGAEWRKAAKTATSAQHAAQRRGRVRRKPPGITGVVVLPPGGAAS